MTSNHQGTIDEALNLISEHRRTAKARAFRLSRKLEDHQCRGLCLHWLQRRHQERCLRAINVQLELYRVAEQSLKQGDYSKAVSALEMIADHIAVPSKLWVFAGPGGLPILLARQYPLAVKASVLKLRDRIAQA